MGSPGAVAGEHYAVRMGLKSPTPVPFCPILSHFAHPQADEILNLKLKGSTPDVVGQKNMIPVPFCPILALHPVSARRRLHLQPKQSRIGVRRRRIWIYGTEALPGLASGKCHQLFRHDCAVHPASRDLATGKERGPKCSIAVPQYGIRS